MRLSDINLDVEEIYQEIVEQLRSKSSFQSIYQGETAKLLAELLAAHAAMLNYRISNAALNSFLDKAFTANAVWSLALSTGGTPPHRKTGARLIGNANGPANVGFTVPAFSRWSGRNLDWYNRDDITVNPGGSTEATLYQGTPRRDSFENPSSRPYFRILIGESFAVDDRLMETESPIRVRVGGVEWTEIQGSLINADLGDGNIWTARNTPDGRVSIGFGNGILGNVPVSGHVDYAITVGAAGNSSLIGDTIEFVSTIEPGSIVGVNGPVTMTVVEARPGQDEESIESIKLTSPRLTAANRRAVRKADYQVALDTYPNVRFASVWGEREEEQESGFADVRNMNTAFISLLKEGIQTEELNILAALQDRSLDPDNVVPDSHLIPVRGSHLIGDVSGESESANGMKGLGVVKGSVQVDFRTNLESRFLSGGSTDAVIAPTTPAGTDGGWSTETNISCWETWALRDADGNLIPWNRFVGSLTSGESAGNHGYQESDFGTLGPTVRNTLPSDDSAVVRFFVSASQIELYFVDGGNSRPADGWTFVVASPRSDFRTPIRLPLSTATIPANDESTPTAPEGMTLHGYIWSDIEGASGFDYARWQQILADGQEVQYRIEGPGWGRPMYNSGFCYLRDGLFRLDDQSGQGILYNEGLGIGNRRAEFLVQGTNSGNISFFRLVFSEPLTFNGLRLRYVNGETPNRLSVLVSTSLDGSSPETIADNVYLPDAGFERWSDWIALGQTRTGIRSVEIQLLSFRGDATAIRPSFVQIHTDEAGTQSVIETATDGSYAVDISANGAMVNTVNLDSTQLFVEELESATIRYVGGNFDASENAEIEAYLNDLKNFTTQLERRDPISQYVDLDVDVYYSSDAPPSRIESDVREALRVHFEENLQAPGRLLAVSDLYRTIVAVDNVDYCMINRPANDIRTARNRFVVLADVTVRALPSQRSV